MVKPDISKPIGREEAMEEAVNFALSECGFNAQKVSPTVRDGMKSAIVHFETSGENASTNPPVAELAVLAFSRLTRKSCPEMHWRWDGQGRLNLRTLSLIR